MFGRVRMNLVRFVRREGNDIDERVGKYIERSEREEGATNSGMGEEETAGP